jgi:PAS domain S-box-containing protein
VIAERECKTSFFFELLQDKALSAGLRVILDCVNDGIFITDNSGTILMLNRASLALCPYDENQLVGRNMRDLLKEGLFDDAVSLQALSEGKDVTAIQKSLRGEYDLLVTATLLREKKEVSLVVVTERDMSELVQLKNEVTSLSEIYEHTVDHFSNRQTAGELIYRSKVMERLVDSVRRIANTDVTVLLQGETGTGKGHIAKYIHSISGRKGKSYIEINCGAIPEALLEAELYGYEKGAFTGADDNGKIGLFELANEGTLFLDEISSIPYNLQSKLLRAIQEKEIMRIGGSKYIPVDIRIIAATNEDLKKAVGESRFRMDLYYRLNIFEITMPPLRERCEDIHVLCDTFLEKYNRKYGRHKTLNQSVWDEVDRYDWPGNVRELENFIERLVIISTENTILPEQVSPFFSPPGDVNSKYEDARSVDLKDEVELFEKNLLESKARYFPSMSALAKALGVDKSTILRKFQKYGIQVLR